MCLLLCVFGTGNAGITIKTSINFGSRQKGCKAGFGLCLVKSEKDPATTVQAEMQLSEDQSLLLIRFPDAVMIANPEQFRDGLFRQDELLILTEEVLSQLGSGKPVSIPPGIYPIAEAGSLKQITVPLQ